MYTPFSSHDLLLSLPPPSFTLLHTVLIFFISLCPSLPSSQECSRLHEELQRLRRENTSLDSGVHEREKTMAQLRTRVAVLEQELKDKEQVVCSVVAMCMGVYMYMVHVHLT